MTSINLQKGQKVDLTKTNPSLKKIGLAFGWVRNGGNSGKFDLDGSVVVIGNNKKAKEVVYFNNQKSQDGAIYSSGDDLEGSDVPGKDNEVIIIEKDKLSSDAERLYAVVNIYDADKRNQNFGMVSNAFCRIFDADTNEELMKYDLSEEYSGSNAVVFGDIYRYGDELKFEILSMPMSGNLIEIKEKIEAL